MSATGSAADWSFVVWGLIFAGFWTTVSVMAGAFIGRCLRNNGRAPKPPRPAYLPCACGCGRMIPRNQNWDGYHGPDPRPAEVIGQERRQMARVVVPARNRAS